ncbi:Protein SUPPRESSOR OF MAX2 1 [Linum perenne]
MRAGLSTIQQTLTPEAATVLNHSIAEAGRRNHGQTTPLHVAATLLSSPSGYLRQACIKSHPNSSHPLQCRALELCFSVALERLPTAQNLNPGPDPPISNALMAALKRAQAHQRRGCPEQQQQPLLAVKVELEQLIISILDDPSVSRVMREASFSSPAVKATIEQSLNSPPPPPPTNSGPIGMGNRNLYMNPRLGGVGSGGGSVRVQREDEVKRVVEILVRGGKKRNPVLVGESEPEMVVKEALRKVVENKDIIGDVDLIHLEKEFVGGDKQRIISKIVELEGLVETRLVEKSGLIIDLGDLKWLVEQGVHQMGSDFGKKVVSEMGNLVGKFREGRRIWLIGTATCETYLRCQVYHPTMENDWDLQALPIANRAPLPGMFPRFNLIPYLLLISLSNLGFTLCD